MRFNILVTILVCALGLGCDKFSGSISPEKEKGLMDKVRQAHELSGQANTGAIKNAIQNFRQAEERFPTSLEELVEKQLLEKIPDAPPGKKFVYHPEDGAVQLVSDGKAPPDEKSGMPSLNDIVNAVDLAGQTQANAELKKIKVAINVYQTQEGRFPGSLDDLVKNGLLEKLPVLGGGRQFSYDSNTGAVQIVSK